MKALICRFPLGSFFILAYVFTWIIEVPMMLEARGVASIHLPHGLEALAAFGPFLAAIVVLRFNPDGPGVAHLFASLLRWRVPTFWLLAAVVSPFLVMFISLMITGETGALLSGDVIRDLGASGRLVEVVLLGGVFRGVGEEPGWRGLALPILRSRFGPLLATLALWPVWLCWHLPSFLMRPEFQVDAWIGFSFGILSAAVWSTLLYDKTRSVLMIVIWHALINITRSIALAVSTAAFLAFAQIMLGLGLIIIIYWLITRPGHYREEGDSG